MFFSTLIIGVAFLPLFTHDRRLGRDLLADGAHLRLRHRRRDPAGAHADAGAGVDAASCPSRRHARTKARELADARARPRSTARSSRRARARRGSRSALGVVPVVLCAGRCSRCSGASSCPSSRRATSGSAPRCRCRSRWSSRRKYVGRMRDPARLPGQSHARATRDPEVTRWSRSSAAPTTAPTSRASTTSSCSRRSSRSTSGRAASPRSKLTDELLDASCSDAFPGVVFNFSQMHHRQRRGGDVGRQGREHASRSIGPDLRVNEHKAQRDRRRDGRRCRGVDGPRHVPLARAARASRITPDRARCARYGLNIGDVEAVVQAAIGGAGGHPGLRGREALRPDGALAGAVPQGRRRHPQHPGRHARRRAGAARPARARSSRRRARRSSTARTAGATRR